MVASESSKLTQEQQQRDVFESHRHRVFSVGYYMTANEVEAESILSETFVHAFTRHRNPDGSSVDRALVGVLGERFVLEPQPAALPDPEVALERTSSRRTDLEEALNHLPPLERLVFLLRGCRRLLRDEGGPAGRVV